MAERVVEISLRIRMINDFDTTAQQCMANMHLVLRWEAPSTETMPTEEILEWEPMWKPRFRIKHLLELVHEQQMFSIVGKNVIEADYFLLCRVRQPLSLRMFPFDAQQLTFEIELLRDCNVVRFQAPEGIPAADVLKEKVFLSDFSLDEKVSHNYRLYFTSKGKSRRKRSYSGLILWVYLQRNPSFYMWNVAFIMFLIISSSLFAFAVNPIQIADRQAVDFSVILTAIAFKTVLSSMLPPVPYWTRLDIYLVACFLYLFSMVAAHSSLVYFFLTRAEMNDFLANGDATDGVYRLYKMDEYACMVAAGVWVAFNLCFALYFSYLHRWCRILVRRQAVLNLEERIGARHILREWSTIDSLVRRDKTVSDMESPGSAVDSGISAIDASLIPVGIAT
ncbi:hypothetical protein CYMTET_50574 [Cymbomonas tetramitiformis]|uniref:Neurotransmitter-gated ion-channel ligand-binding domain-containing protein n=1 Tax=Cymbomonas tetramitiformis TaxID=36881 RepID=A0AAE0EUL9_9CHLO|nr:hypothetical protein CYMTET_50574 [Cymbomonas tetramitiformis]|eukprot:gene18390-21935_t